MKLQRDRSFRGAKRCRERSTARHCLPSHRTKKKTLQVAAGFCAPSHESGELECHKQNVQTQSFSYQITKLQAALIQQTLSPMWVHYLLVPISFNYFSLPHHNPCTCRVLHLPIPHSTSKFFPFKWKILNHILSVYLFFLLQPMSIYFHFYCFS